MSIEERLANDPRYPRRPPRTKWPWYAKAGVTVCGLYIVMQILASDPMQRWSKSWGEPTKTSAQTIDEINAKTPRGNPGLPDTYITTANTVMCAFGGSLPEAAQ